MRLWPRIVAKPQGALRNRASLFLVRWTPVAATLSGPSLPPAAPRSLPHFAASCLFFGSAACFFFLPSLCCICAACCRLLVCASLFAHRSHLPHCMNSSFFCYATAIIALLA